MTLALVGQRLRRDDVNEVGVVDTQSGRDAGKSFELCFEENRPREISLNDKGAGKGLIWRTGKLRGMVDHSADDAAIAYSSHAGEFLSEFFPAYPLSLIHI